MKPEYSKHGEVSVSDTDTPSIITNTRGYVLTKYHN